MGTNLEMQAELTSMPLTRITHFTPARNLPHIMSDRMLRSVKDLAEDVRACYTSTDLRRLDGYQDRISCSLEYPNAYYYTQAASKPEAANYSDWVCLLLDKQVAAADGALFCPRNAAAYDAVCVPGVEGIRGCYLPAVLGAGGRTWTRGSRHSPACPTDVQAEALIPGPIPLSAVRAIAVPSQQAAVQEHSRLDQLGLPAPAFISWIISPGMFNRNAVSNAVRFSMAIDETIWAPSTSPATGTL